MEELPKGAEGSQSDDGGWLPEPMMCWLMFVTRVLN